LRLYYVSSERDSSGTTKPRSGEGDGADSPT
jgi:hypothetical protein